MPGFSPIKNQQSKIKPFVGVLLSPLPLWETTTEELGVFIDLHIILLHDSQKPTY